MSYYKVGKTVEGHLGRLVDDIISFREETSMNGEGQQHLNIFMRSNRASHGGPTDEVRPEKMAKRALCAQLAVAKPSHWWVRPK